MWRPHRLSIAQPRPGKPHGRPRPLPRSALVSPAFNVACLARISSVLSCWCGHANISIAFGVARFRRAAQVPQLPSPLPSPVLRPSAPGSPLASPASRPPACFDNALADSSDSESCAAGGGAGAGGLPRLPLLVEGGGVGLSSGGALDAVDEAAAREWWQGSDGADKDATDAEVAAAAAAVGREGESARGGAAPMKVMVLHFGYLWKVLEPRWHKESWETGRSQGSDWVRAHCCALGLGAAGRGVEGSLHAIRDKNVADRRRAPITK